MQWGTKMSFLYNAKNNMFYPLEFKAKYEESGDWPSDATLVDDSVFTEFTGPAPDGKVRAAGADGLPFWADMPAPTEAEQVLQVEATRTALRAVADAEIAWRQDAVNAGIATEEEIAMLAEWKKYRVLLMRVDATKPVWPTVPGGQAS